MKRNRRKMLYLYKTYRIIKSMWMEARQTRARDWRREREGTGAREADFCMYDDGISDGCTYSSYVYTSNILELYN